MNIHVLVTVYQGCAEGVQAFADREAAEQAHAKAKSEMGIADGMEGESENAAELFFYIEVN